MRIRQVLAILAVGSVLGCYAKTADNSGQSGAKANPAAPAAGTPTAPAQPGVPHPALLDPSQAIETAPATYKVKFETTQGSFRFVSFLISRRGRFPWGRDRFSRRCAAQTGRNYSALFPRFQQCEPLIGGLLPIKLSGPAHGGGL